MYWVKWLYTRAIKHSDRLLYIDSIWVLDIVSSVHSFFIKSFVFSLFVKLYANIENITVSTRTPVLLGFRQPRKRESYNKLFLEQ